MCTANSRGFSYVELTIVVLILGVAAAVVLPNFAARDAQNLALAADEIANALRYARSQAIASGEHHGVSVSETTHAVSVFKADMTTSPVSIGETSTHPLTKQSYAFDLDDWSVDITNSSGVFYYGSGGGYRTLLLFDADGTPVWHIASTGITYQLVASDIELQQGQHSVTVHVAPLTGRVSQS